MSGPWEQYKEEVAPSPLATSEPAEAGPWQKFEAPAPRPDFDTTEIKQLTEKYISEFHASKAELPAGPQSDADPAREAKDFSDAFLAGLQLSTSVLTARDKMPDVVMPEDAPMLQSLTSTLGTVIGDVPAMVGGFIGGSMVGGPLVGFGVANAAPAMLRQVLIDQYQKGSVRSWDEAWPRIAATAWEGVKGFTVGAASMGAGAMASKVVAGSAAPFLAKVAAPKAAEIATMTTVGKALEGEMPSYDDFLEGAIFITGLHVAGVAGKAAVKQHDVVKTKLMNMWAKTGKKPGDVALAASSDPVLLQDLNATNVTADDITGSGRPNSKQVPAGDKHSALSEGFDNSSDSVIAEQKPPTAVSGELEAKPGDGALDKVSAGKGVDEVHPIDKMVAPIDSGPPATEIKWNRIYTAAIDNLHPVKRFQDVLSGKATLEPKADPYVLARLTRGNYGRADYFMNHAPYDYHTLKDTGSRPLRKIIESAKNAKEFERYLIAKHANRLKAQGIETPFDYDGPGGTKATEEAGAKKYDKLAKEITQYRNESLKYLHDSGLITKEMYEASLTKHDASVPFMVDEKAGSGAGKGMTTYNPVKKIKGNKDKAIVSPFKSLVTETQLRITLAERNRVLVSLVELAEKTPEGQALMQKVKTPVRPIEVKPDEIARHAKEQGIELDADALTIFRPEKLPLAKDEIAIYRNGKREIYKVPEEVAEALKGLDGETVGWLTKFLSVPAQLTRAGVTSTPDFQLRNIVRDQPMAFVLSPNGYLPFWDYFMGMGSLMKTKAGQKTGQVDISETWANWMKGGGAQASYASVDRTYLQSDIGKLSKQTGIMDKTVNGVKKPFEIASIIQEMSEVPTRLGEFHRSTKGKGDINSVLKGAFDARNVTLDFARHGAKMQALRLTIPFFNPSIQGLDYAARAFRDRPISFSVKAFTAITLPTYALWWAQRNDPRIDEVQHYQQDLHFVIATDKWEKSTAADAKARLGTAGDPSKYSAEDYRDRENHLARNINGEWWVNNGAVRRIPMPHEVGVMFGALPRRMLDAFFTDNPHAFEGFQRTMVESFAPPYMAGAVSPVLEQFANRSFFTGNPIVPQSLEKNSPVYQVTNYTSETAKMIGSLVGNIPMLKDVGRDNITLASPMVIENYVKSWTGGAGMYILQAVDYALESSGKVPPKVKAADTLADIPVVKAFHIRHPGLHSQSSERFYERFQKTETKAADIKLTAQMGDVESLEREVVSGQENGTIVHLKGIAEAASKLGAVIRRVDMLPDMTPNDKRQLIDQLLYTRIQLFQEGNRIMDETKNMFKDEVSQPTKKASFGQ